jgi:hypothetical protein
MIKRGKGLVYVKFLMVVLLFWTTNSCRFSTINQSGNEPLLVERKVILEIITDASESSYPSGKILDIKLYNNKTVEFDFYLPNTPDRIGMKFTSEKKEAKINQEDFIEIDSLLRKSDLVNAKNYYAPSRHMSVDSFMKKTITFKVENQEKTIVLEERDSHLHLEEKSDLYPTSLIKLLELTEEVNKNLRKQIDPESR